MHVIIKLSSLMQDADSTGIAKSQKITADNQQSKCFIIVIKTHCLHVL